MKEFDKIYVGSSPVMMLDALNENLNKKKKILIIDKDKVLGGAWKCLNIFGFEGLENAVHYLLPNSTGYRFIEENFNIKLENSSRKYYAVKIFGLNILINVRNYLGKLLYSLNGGDQAENFTIPSLLKYLFKNRKVSLTKYPKEGIVSWVNCIIQSIYKSNVKINLEEEISQIEVKDNRVFLLTNLDKYVCSKLVVSHGFIPPKHFKINNQLISFNLKKHPRPSLHINTNVDKPLKLNSKPMRVSQALFPRGSNIKYVHQISQFLSPNNQHVVVAALKHELKYSLKNCNNIANELENFGLIPKSTLRTRKDFFWQDILIPQIDNDDLSKISKDSNNIIITMQTDCLNTSLGKYSTNWNFKSNQFKKN